MYNEFYNEIYKIPGSSSEVVDVGKIPNISININVEKIKTK